MVSHPCCRRFSYALLALVAVLPASFACARAPSPCCPADATTPAAATGRMEVAAVADALDQALTRQVVAVRTLAENAFVRDFVVDGEDPHRVLTTLRDVVTRAAADGASLLDADGVVVVSTDPTAVGYDFSHWRFVEASLEGGVLVFPAVGFVADRRALYTTAPVVDADGARRALAVLRTGPGGLDRVLSRLDAPAALVYRDRYVLATNREAWGFHGLRRLHERGAQLDLEAPPHLDLLDAVVPPIGRLVEAEGEAWAVERVPMVAADWQLLVGHPVRTAAPVFRGSLPSGR